MRLRPNKLSTAPSVCATGKIHDLHSIQPESSTFLERIATCIPIAVTDSQSNGVSHLVPYSSRFLKRSCWQETRSLEGTSPNSIQSGVSDSKVNQKLSVYNNSNTRVHIVSPLPFLPGSGPIRPSLSPQVGERQLLLLSVEVVLSSSISFAAQQAILMSTPGYLVQEYNCHAAFGLEGRFLGILKEHLQLAEQAVKDCGSLMDLISPDSPAEFFTTSLCRAMAARVKRVMMPYITSVRELFQEIDGRISNRIPTSLHS